MVRAPGGRRAIFEALSFFCSIHPLHERSTGTKKNQLYE